jgi:ubiquinone/menaquinone biosynthesis C-methylase UbiE
MRGFGDDVFKVTAKYYFKYKPEYPLELFKDIVTKLKSAGIGKLLDLSCGSGELAIPPAKYFEQVLALDPDQGMLNNGINNADKLNINNIEWQKGSCKTLDRVNEKFKLCAMGQSFHWMEGEIVLKILISLLEVGGGLVIIGTSLNRSEQRFYRG